MSWNSRESDQPLVSVIVPTRNSERYLSTCLQSIQEQDYSNIELIVVDRDSSDSTVSIAQSFNAKLLNAGPERSAQVNAGAKVAKGEYLFRVDSDFRLETSVVSECISLVRAGADAVVVHNTAIEIGWLSKIRKFEVDMYKYSLDHSAARFISMNVFQSIGGYSEDLTAGEDYDFQNRITHYGYCTRFCNAEATHLDEPTQLVSVLQKYFLYGRDFSRYRSKNKKRSQIQLAFFRRNYFAHMNRMLQRPFLALGLIAYHCLKYFSGGLGYVSAVLWSPRRTKK